MVKDTLCPGCCVYSPVWRAHLKFNHAVGKIRLCPARIISVAAGELTCRKTNNVCVFASQLAGLEGLGALDGRRLASHREEWRNGVLGRNARPGQQLHGLYPYSMYYSNASYGPQRGLQMCKGIYNAEAEYHHLGINNI
jgi:hypothetical protein